MAVAYNRGAKAPAGTLVADRHLYLDSTGNRIVEQGDAASASQFVAAGHPIDPAEADRLGLVEKNGKVVQDHEAKIADLRKNFDELEAEKKAMYEQIDAYRKENAVKDIPNTMEAARVDLEQRYEVARITLAQAIKAEAGKDPFLGESQATAIEPEKSDTAVVATMRAKAAVAAAPAVPPTPPAKKPAAAAKPAAKTAAKKSAAKKGARK